MTEEERKNITKMRRDGIGYTSIARMLGVSENTVKSFCRRNGLTGNRSYKLSKSHVCQYCGAPVEQTPGRKEKKFCSDDCRMKWWAAHQEKLNRKAVYEYVCPACGKPFTAYGNAHRKYCCHACYIADRFGGAKDE